MPDSANNPTTALEVRIQPPTVAFDYERVKAALEKEVAQYNIVVTDDTIKGAREMATALNQRAQEIDQIRKDRIAEVSRPIREADEQMKALVKVCKDGRAKIMEQLNVYEQKAIERVRSLLTTKLEQLYEEQGVDPEYQAADIADLVKKGSMTDKGNLTGAAREALSDRVGKCLELQKKVAFRLDRLESESTKAGLDAPLSREHVEHFLFESDEVYTQRLDALLNTEVERQRAAESRRQAKAEEAAQAAAQAAPAEASNAPTNSAPPPEQPPTPAPAQGRTAWRVTAIFDVTAPNHVEQQKIESKLRKMLADAGITDSLVSVEATRA